MKEKYILGQPRENWIYLFLAFSGCIVVALFGYFQNGGGL
jgi:hypothetical protein